MNQFRFLICHEWSAGCLTSLIVVRMFFVVLSQRKIYVLLVVYVQLDVLLILFRSNYVLLIGQYINS